MKLRYVITFTVVLSTIALGQNKFPMTCHPFQGIEAHHPIDATCGLEGNSSKPGLQAQDKAKNSFCAGQNYQDITRQDLIDKQKNVAAIPGYISWEGEDVPADRSAFVKLGEGTAVRFTGYVFDAKYADLSSGESVNCSIKDDTASNDIHIALVEQSNVSDSCQSITAEMSPHYRPTTWTAENITKIGKKTLVRVSGALMYDASHKICGEQGFSPTDNPHRISGWEIHPVYAFEVCAKQSGTTCTQWQPLSDWAAAHSKPSHPGHTKPH